MSMNCRFLPIFTVAQKIQENQIKNQRNGSFQSPKEGQGGHLSPRRLGGAAGWCGPPRVPPLSYILLVPETLGVEPFLRYLPLFHRRGDSKIVIARRTCPGTLPEGGLTSRSLSTTMSA